MSKQHTTDHHDEIEDATIVDQQTFVSADTAAKSVSNRTAVVAVIIAIIALFASGYSTWVQWHQQPMLSQISSDSQAAKLSLSTVNKRLDRVDKSLMAGQKNQQQATALHNTAIKEINQRLASNSRRLGLVANTTTDDWQIAEVEYLLRLASQRLLIAKDGRTALNLLANSDAILVSLADPSWLDLRAAIAADRLAIASIDQLDVDGLFLRLAAINAKIEALPLLRSRLERTSVITPVEPPASDEAMPVMASLQQLAWQTWQELKTLVVVHSSTEPVKPLLPPEQHYYLRSNLRLLINQAQLALIDSRQPSYQHSLSQAVQWLNKYFAADDASISAIVVELEQLMKHDISRALPGVEQSLIALKKTHKQRQLAVKLSTKNSAIQSSSKTAEKSPASAGKR
tara:strand:- start:282 stop:1481 length:1200 start_codon:yes stop_codon:yes gene_type:complete